MSPVPQDFPRRVRMRGVEPATQLTTSAIRFDEMYSAASNVDEREERWELCEDLARQLCHVAIEDAMHRSHEQALARLREALRRRSWVTAPELNWLMHRLRSMLRW